MSLFKKIFSIFFDEWETKGVSVPLMYDPVADRASLTVMFPYVSFWMTCLSLIALHVWPAIWPASVGCGALWLVSTVLYMIRKLTKAKFDLDDKSIEFEGGEDESVESVSKDSSTVGSNVRPDPV